MGPSVKCANWPSQSNCEAISCALSSKTPTFITIHEMQPFPRKSGEMQMFKGWWRRWRSAGRPLCPAQVGHDSYLLWQRPVSTHTDAQPGCTPSHANSPSVSLRFLRCTHVMRQRAGWYHDILSRLKVTRAHGILQDQRESITIKSKGEIARISTQRLCSMSDVGEGEILLVWVFWITEAADSIRNTCIRWTLRNRASWCRKSKVRQPWR